MASDRMRVHDIGEWGDVLVELLDELHVLRTQRGRDLRIRGLLAPCDELPVRMPLRRRGPDLDGRRRRPRQPRPVRGVGLRGVDTISITDPCLFVTTADDKDDRSTIARMDRPQASQGIFTLDNPDPGRLEVLGRWSYASCLENHVQLVIRDRKAVK